jgi:Mg-chelatase subunit ChlD/ribosomal protein L7/L12
MTDNLLKFSATPDRNQLPAGQTKSAISCQVSIEADAAAGGTSEMATTASICLVFDCSGSMIGKKFKAAVETAKMIVDILHERHLISLVAFQTDSHILFENAVPTEANKDSIKQQIDNLDLYLGGSTNMAAGVKSAQGVLADGNADADIVVLLSDGAPNSARKAQMAAEEASHKGIQFFAVGIGGSYNADQLLRLVTPSNGAVFGASEADKINDIFYDLINRIDQIIATNVILNFTFDERVQLKQVFKTSPERAQYDSSSINSNNNNLELRVGNIENAKVYEFLLQMEVEKVDVGAIDLLRAKLQYDINHLGVNLHAQEVIVTVDFQESAPGTEQPGISTKIVDAMRSATMVQLGDELVQACSTSDNDRALQAIDKLQQQCDEENNVALQRHLDSMKSQLETGGRVSDKDRNDFLLASTAAPISAPTPPAPAPPPPAPDPPPPPPKPTPPPPKPKPTPPPPAAPAPPPPAAPTPAPPTQSISPRAVFFDLILVDPGSEPIRLLREIRDVTGMGLRELAEIIKHKNSVVTVFEDKASAEKLKQQFVKSGATFAIHGREAVEEVRRPT